jgi:hypothetical protein
LKDFKGREPLFFLRISLFHNMRVELSVGGMHWEKTMLKRAQGQAGQPRRVASRPHFAPKYSEIFSKIPLEITQLIPTPEFGN